MADAPAVHGSRPYFRISILFFRRPVLNPARGLELLVTLQNLHVKDMAEALSYGRELIFINARGIWQTPEPYYYFFKVVNLGVDPVRTRESLDGSDGETGAARRRGELPKGGYEQ